MNELLTIPEHLIHLIAEMITRLNMLEKPFEHADKNGYYYPAKHFQTVGGAVILLPLEQIANYSSAPGRSSVNIPINPAAGGMPALDDKSFKSATDFNWWNAMSIGNLAYVYLYTTHKQKKEIARMALRFYGQTYIERMESELKATNN